MELMKIDARARWALHSLPDCVMRHIFTYLTPTELESCRQVSTRWNQIAAHHSLWRKHCFEHSPSLQTERTAWPLLASCQAVNPIPWRHVFRTLQNRPRWVVPLHKSGRFLFNMIVHLIKGPYAEVPEVLVVKRRFDIMYLPMFLGANCTYFYLEPLSDADRAPYEDFVQYLIKRERAGLVLLPMKKLMLIPPCGVLRQQVNYSGERLIGAVQSLRV